MPLQQDVVTTKNRGAVSRQARTDDVDKFAGASIGVGLLAVLALAASVPFLLGYVVYWVIQRSRASATTGDGTAHAVAPSTLPIAAVSTVVAIVALYLAVWPLAIGAGVLGIASAWLSRGRPGAVNRVSVAAIIVAVLAGALCVVFAAGIWVFGSGN